MSSWGEFDDPEVKGWDVVELVFLNVGRALGDQAYSLFTRSGRGPNEANWFLIEFLKKTRLAKDAAIFGTLSEVGGPELVCRVVGGRLLEVCAGKGGERPALKLIQGLIHRYYERLTNQRVKTRALSSAPYYELVVRLETRSSELKKDEPPKTLEDAREKPTNP